MDVHLQKRRRLPNRLQLWATLCLYTLLMGAVYIVNQIADRETDARNNKLYLVAQGYVKLRILKWQIGFLITLSLLLNLLVFSASYGVPRPHCLVNHTRICLFRTSLPSQRHPYCRFMCKRSRLWKYRLSCRLDDNDTDQC